MRVFDIATEGRLALGVKRARQHAAICIVIIIALVVAALLMRPFFDAVLLFAAAALGFVAGAGSLFVVMYEKMNRIDP